MDERTGPTKRRTEITIETHSITIMRTNGQRFSAHCKRCEKTVSAFAPKQVAAFLRLDLTEVCRRIEAKQIHLTNDDEGVAMVCANSLGATQIRTLTV